MRVTFDGEDGIDAGGLRREFTSLAFEAAVEHLFEDGGYGQRLPKPRADGVLLEAFGRLLLKGLHDDVQFSALHSLPLLFFRFLRVEADPSESKTADAWFSAHAAEIRVSVDDYMRFSGSLAAAQMERVRLMDDRAMAELGLELPSGAPLTSANRDEYLKWAPFDALVGARWAEMCAVWRGFHDASGAAIRAPLQALFADDLPLLLGGVRASALDVRALLNEGTIALNHFPGALEAAVRGALASLSPLEARQMLMFATGSDALPFRPAKPYLRFVFSDERGMRNGLWVAHTCFKVVDVPSYDDAQATPDALRAKLLKSMELGCGSFGMR
jgi:hypothetical protein